MAKAVEKKGFTDYPVGVRMVFDTNVIIDGFSDDFSAQARLLEEARQGKIIALITPAIEREYRLILDRLINDPRYRDRVMDFLAQAEQVRPQHVDIHIDDPEDYKFLQAAVGGNADILVSMDQHLLSANEAGQTRIMRPQEAWAVYEDNSGKTSNNWTDFVKGLGIGLLLVGLLLSSSAVHAQTDAVKELTQNQQLIADKQKEIEELNKKIETLRTQRDSVAAEAGVINSQVQKLENQVAKAELEVKQIQLTINSVNYEQTQTEKNVSDLEQSLNEKRQQLRELIRALHEHEQQSMVGVFLSNFSLGDILTQRAVYLDLQQHTFELMNGIHASQKTLSEKQQALQEQEQQLRNLQGALTEQQTELEVQQQEKTSFLKKKKQEQLNYEHDLAIAQKTRAEIEQNVFKLKDVGVNIKLNDASDMARYASKLTGVRAALLMGILKVESDVGNNVGGGHFPDDMHPASRDAFLRIIKKLNLDPATAPISARPRSYQGWGGAMGPGQFMPDTWERIEERLITLLHHEPNPYDLADAFTATGMFLADKGAADRSKEYEAVNRYLAGPNWQNFTWYGDRVLSVAKEYEREGL